MLLTRIGLFLLFLLVPLGLFAQEPAKWTLSIEPATGELKTGERSTGKLKADIDAGWHLYALEQPAGGPIATTIKISEGSPFALNGKIESPKATVRVDPLFTSTNGKPLETKFFAETVTFTVPVK